MGTGVGELAIAAIGTALATYGAVDQADSARRQAHYQADQTAANADADKGAAAVQAAQIEKQGAVQRAQAQAQLAASGVDVGAGTPIQVDRQIVQNTEQDAITATLGGAARARAGYGQAAALRIGAGNAQRAGYINAASTALGGATSTYRAGYGQ